MKQKQKILRCYRRRFTRLRRYSDETEEDSEEDSEDASDEQKKIQKILMSIPLLKVPIKHTRYLSPVTL